MDEVLHFVARMLVAVVQRLPLTWVARLGRIGGAVAYRLDSHRRRLALDNLTLCFARERSEAEIRAVAREHFRRIGESFACAIKTASMSVEELRPHLQLAAPAAFTSGRPGEKPGKVVAAIGRFGNFELYARFGLVAPGYKLATTYRALRQPLLNRLWQSLREQSDCLFFERRFDAAALRTFMNEPGILLGLLADQPGGPRGLRLPFFGVDCSTSPAPALFALRYSCSLYTGICYRLGLGKWRIEGGAEIPTQENGRPRPTRDIMLDVNRAFEAAIRKDPANWFWVQNRWKDLRRNARGETQPPDQNSTQAQEGAEPGEIE